MGGKQNTHPFFLILFLPTLAKFFKRHKLTQFDTIRQGGKNGKKSKKRGEERKKSNHLKSNHLKSNNMKTEYRKSNYLKTAFLKFFLTKHNSCVYEHYFKKHTKMPYIKVIARD